MTKKIDIELQEVEKWSKIWFEFCENIPLTLPTPRTDRLQLFYHLSLVDQDALLSYLYMEVARWLEWVYRDFFVEDNKLYYRESINKLFKY